MDDDDFFNDYDGQCDFEYEEAEDGDDIVLSSYENKYLLAKGLVSSDPKEAAKLLNEIIQNEPQPREWSFKATKNLVKAQALCGCIPESLQAYRSYLSQIQAMSFINLSCEKSVLKLLERIRSITSSTLANTIGEFCSTTISFPVVASNKRILFLCKMRIAALYYEAGEYEKLKKLIFEIESSCLAKSDGPDLSTLREQLELLAIQIKMQLATSQHMGIFYTYKQAMRLSELTNGHPRDLSVICGTAAKSFMLASKWQAARDLFYDAFKLYDEAGMNTERLCALKYLVYASLLCGWKQDPFDSKETLPYRDHPDLSVVVSLSRAYVRHDILVFESVIEQNQREFENDAILRHCRDNLLRSVRFDALPSVLKPFQKIPIDTACSMLKLPRHAFELALREDVRKSNIAFKINMLDDTVEADKNSEDANLSCGDPNESRLKLMQRWAACTEVLGRLSSNCGVLRKNANVFNT